MTLRPDSSFLKYLHAVAVWASVLSFMSSEETEAFQRRLEHYAEALQKPLDIQLSVGDRGASQPFSSSWTSSS